MNKEKMREVMVRYKAGGAVDDVGGYVDDLDLGGDWVKIYADKQKEYPMYWRREEVVGVRFVKPHRLGLWRRGMKEQDKNRKAYIDSIEDMSREQRRMYKKFVKYWKAREEAQQMQSRQDSPTLQRDEVLNSVIDKNGG